MDKKVLFTAIILFAGGVGFFLYGDSFFASPPVPPSPREEAERIVEACKEISGDQTAHERCTAQKFSATGTQWGIAFIGKVLTAYQGLNKEYQSYQNCHVLAHGISNILASREPNAWKELLQQMNEGQLDPNRCGGGFVHGVLEVHAGQDSAFKINAGLFRELCAGTLNHVSSSCAHILGHLALVEGFGEVDETLKACVGLSGDFLFQCYGGIFMEDSMRTNLHDHGLADLPERTMDWLATQVTRCNRYANKKEIANGCWYDLPEVFLQTHHYDLGKTYEFCNNAPNKEAKDHCAIRASYLVAITPDSLFKVFPIQKLCAIYTSGSPELTRCMQEVVGAALTGSMSFIDRMISFCTERGDPSKDQCFGVVAEHVTRLAKGEQKKMLCNKLPEQSRASCLKIIEVK